MRQPTLRLHPVTWPSGKAAAEQGQWYPGSTGMLQPHSYGKSLRVKPRNNHSGAVGRGGNTAVFEPSPSVGRNGLF